MPHRPPEKLIRDLADTGLASPYLERLRAALDVNQAHDELEKEIRREIASALGRAEEKLIRALAELDLMGKDLAALTAHEGDEEEACQQRVNACVRAYNRQRDVAQRCFWELVVHREALGIRRNEILKQFYPIPSRKREFPIAD